MSKYTWDDITNMSPVEYTHLLNEFERIYDPFNTYDESYISNVGIEPLWTSGSTNKNNEWVDSGSHDYITMTACTMMMNDKGFYSKNAAQGVVISLLISIGSFKPDQEDKLKGFVGHFYSPNNEKNYFGQTSNTARTNASKHYTNAVKAADKGDMETAYEQLGRCLHFIQDASEPHHAANITGVNPSHSAFEKFAFGVTEKYLGTYNTMANSYYQTAKDYSVSTLTHKAAQFANPKSKDVDSILDKSKWESTAKSCLQSATRYSAMVLYKFSTISSVPFYAK